MLNAKILLIVLFVLLDPSSTIRFVLVHALMDSMLPMDNANNALPHAHNARVPLNVSSALQDSTSSMEPNV